MLQARGVKQYKLHFANMRGSSQRLGRAGDGDLRRQLSRITVNAGRDAGKGNGLEL